MESQVPKTMKEEQYDSSPQDLSVMDIKLEPVDEDLKYLDSSEYVVKNDTVETEALAEPSCVPIKSEQDSEQMSEETIKEETVDTIQTTEDVESSGSAVKREVCDSQQLLEPFFVPVEAEPYSEGTSEESAMEESFKATESEDIQVSTTPLMKYSEAKNSVSESRKGLNRHAVHSNSKDTTKAHKKLLTQCLYHKGKSREENFKKSAASSSSSFERELRGEYKKRNVSQLEMCGKKSSSSGERLFRKQVNVKGSRNEIQYSSSKGSSSKQSKIQKETRKPFCCNICGKCFQRTCDLENHERIHCGDIPFQCALCNKTCTTKGSLLDHMRVHSENKPYKCSFCEKTFKRSSELKIHIRIHTGEKPFDCSVCRKAFAHNSTLSTHMRSHTSEKPYSCTVCGGAFSRSTDLTSHMRLHTGERPYKCTECRSAFHRSSGLTMHMRIHSGERRYRCAECKSAFLQKGHLTAHMRTHTSDKPYACTYCEKAFSRGSSLTIHKRVHTGERPFACNNCGSRFMKSSHLTNHRACVHGAAPSVSPDSS